MEFGCDRHFVGRAEELATLDRTFRLAAGGQRRIVVLVGEPGVGKTWLAQRAADRAERAGFTVVHRRCWPHGGAPSLWPWPAIADALAGPGPARSDAGEDPPPDRFTRFAEIGARIAAGCAQAPALVVLDDVHRADGGVALLTRFLSRTLDRLPLVLLLARRTEPAVRGPEVEELLADVAADATVLPVRRFDVHETAAYLAAHGIGDPGRGLALPLLRLTGGNPLFLARAVALDDPSPSGMDRVEHAIAGALERLPAEVRHVVSRLAVLGVDAQVAELSALVGARSADVLDGLDAAARAGLLEPTPDGGYAFTHELVRQVALAGLTPGERQDAHARAAAILSDAGPDPDDAPTAARCARHALAAAGRSEHDAERAVAACRTAARAHLRGHDYERAVHLLDRAAPLVARRDPAVRATVLLERADALLACGRLHESRQGFERAADAAARASDPTLLARAFLGLGGMWVNEHRDAAGRERLLGGLRIALAELPATESALRCRIRVRLAAEDVYAGGSLQPVRAALAGARSEADDRVLAEALSLTHHAMLAPAHAAERLGLADELVAVASRAGEGVLTLFGLTWRTVDLYLLGDERADRSLGELRARAEALGCRNVQFVVAAIEVMRLIRAGRLDEAEAAAAECLGLGAAVGDQDATGFYAGQLLTIRWIQGRDGELLDQVREVADSPTLVAAEFALRAAVAMTAARVGRTDEARAVLDRLTADGAAALPASSNWLVGMATVVEAAVLLGDAQTARAAGALLAPFAHRPVMASLAISCLGSAERALGQVALIEGHPGAAVTRLESALRATLRLGNRPVAAVLRAELAEALVARGHDGDLERASGTLAHAHGEAVAMGLDVRAAAWSDRLASYRAMLDRVEQVDGVLLRREGDRWLLVYGRRRTRLPALVGLAYLAVLLDRPGEEVSALDLSVSGTAEQCRDELADDTAVRAYRRRLAELDARLSDAEAAADLGQADRLATEREQLLAHLSGVLGVGGRHRAFATSGERARTAVYKALRRALDQIAAADPGLGADLRRCIRMGASCCYEPDGTLPVWRVDRVGVRSPSAR